MESQPPATLSLSVACGPVPCDSEEGRDFLQDRLALFGKVCLALSAGHYLLSNVLATLVEGNPASAWLHGRELPEFPAESFSQRYRGEHSGRAKGPTTK